MARLTVDPIVAMLAAGSLLAGALVLVQLRHPPYDAMIVLPDDGAPPEIAAAPAWSMPPASAFETVLARPLFSEGRRPPQPSLAGEPTVASESDLTITATAIILTPERRLALVEQGSDSTVLLTEGGVLDGWRLVEIGAEHLLFRADSRLQRVALKDLPDETADEMPATADNKAAPAPRLEALSVTIAGRAIEILPEHADERGEGSILAAMPAPEPDSAAP